MIGDFWINLPVKDLGRSKRFFQSLGFAPNPGYPGTDGASFFIGTKRVVLMLFVDAAFEKYARTKAIRGAEGAEVLFSFDCASKAEVDEVARKAAEAGGTVFAQPGGTDWMYGCGFSDPDGHRWTAICMNATQAKA